MTTSTVQRRRENNDSMCSKPGASPTVAVVIPLPMRRQILTSKAERQLAGFATVVDPTGDQVSAEELNAALDGAVACLTGWGTPPLTSDMLQSHPDLRLVAHTAGSIRRLIPEGAMERGLRVSHAAGVIADAVVEQVITSALLCLRPLHKIDQEMKSGGEWMELRERYPGRLLGAQTVGIVGAGYVGRLMIRLFQAFGCKVLVADPFLDVQQASALGVERRDVATLMQEADIVSLHAPLLPETEGMIGATELASLRDDGIFINAARSALVDEAALLAELRSGRIMAVLDVFDEEPLPLESPFRTLPNVVISPHSAGHTIDSHFRQGTAMVAEIQHFLNGESLQYEVTPAMLAMMA